MKTQKTIKRRWASALCLVAALVLAMGMVGCARVVDTDEYPGEPPSEGKTPFWAEYTPEQLREYWKKKMLPGILEILAYLGAMKLASSPTLKRVLEASVELEKSSDEIKKTNKNAEDETQRNKARYIKMQKAVADAVAVIKEEMHAAMEEMRATKEQVAQDNALTRAEMEKVYDIGSDILLMCKLGFGEDTELVKKGIASQIAKIGEGGEHDDPQT